MRSCKAGSRRKPESRLRKSLLKITYEMKRDPQIASILQQRTEELGVDENSRLARVFQAPTLEHALAHHHSRELGISM